MTEETLKALGEAAVARFKGAVTSYALAYGELTLLAGRDQIVEVLQGLKDEPEFRFQQLIDLCGVDYPERPLRFDVVYHLLSLTKNLRIRVKVQTDAEAPVPSVTPVYPNADWYEREAFDMYGVKFEGHPDLRRILLPEDWTGYPLRKDYGIIQQDQKWVQIHLGIESGQ